jgi:hypothetical protein
LHRGGPLANTLQDLDFAALDGILQDSEVTVRRLFLAGNPIGSM